MKQPRARRDHCLQLTLLFAILWLAIVNSALATDAIDRLALEHLKATRAAVERFKSERKQVLRQDGYRDHRANLHVHSAWSHDSRGTIDEIVTAAKAVGTTVLMFTEHPAGHYDIFTDGHQGMRDGVLLIPGAETGGMLVFPRHSIKPFDATKTQEFADVVRGRDGLIFVSHLEERMDWHVRGITGVEIYNTHADVKGEQRLLAAMKRPTWMFSIAKTIQQYPQEVFSALQDYPSDYLKRWDELCQIAPQTGVSANDSHQNIGVTVRLGDKDEVHVQDALGDPLLMLTTAAYQAVNSIPPDARVGDVLYRMRLDPYECSLRHVGTHLLLSELSQAAAWDALNAGRAYVAFDWMADATGFDFAIKNSAARHEMGSEMPFEAGLTFTGRAPLAAHWRLIRNGAVVSETRGDEFDFPVRQSGVYRVELWLKLAEEERIWVLSNPIYIRSS